MRRTKKDRTMEQKGKVRGTEKQRCDEWRMAGMIGECERVNVQMWNVDCGLWKNMLAYGHQAGV